MAVADRPGTRFKLAAQVPEGDYLLRVWRGEGRPGKTERLAVTGPIEGLLVRAEPVTD